MSGGFVLVVGPSGAGKDTLIGLAKAELAAEPCFVFPRRLVTRPSSAFEEHDTISDQEFESGRREGRFTLSWRAHGLGYALPGSCRALAAAGRIVVCNVSRTQVEDARRVLDGVRVVAVTAPPRVLAERLQRRGRADDADLEARLARSSALPDIGAELTIVNDKSAEEAARRFVGFLHEWADALRPAAV
jgi:ribose 1,5-bisphosphokinase